MSSRSVGCLVLALQALWAVAGPGAHADDKLPPASTIDPGTVVAAAPKSWPPQYGVDGAGNPVGFAIDVMDEVARRAGLRVVYRVVDDFAAAEAAIANRTADIIPNYGITEGRRDHFLFTRPVETFAISIVVRNDTAGVHRLGDLKGRHVGVVARNVGADIVAEHPDILAHVFPSPEKALFDLLAGQADAVVFPRPVMRRLAHDIGVEGRIKFVGPPLAEIKRAIAVRKDRVELLSVFDAAVEAFVGTSDYRRLYVKWYGTPAPYWTANRILWAAGGIIAGLLIVFALWRYRLAVRTYRHVAASEEQFRELIEGAVPGVLIHRDHRPLFVNRSYASIFGYYDPEEMLRQGSALDHVAPDEHARLKAYAAARIRGIPTPEVYEFQGIKKDGTLIWLENRGRVVDWQGKPAIQRTVVDVTAKRRAETELMLRSSQQAVVAELGQRALTDDNLETLMATAVNLVAKFVESDLCGLLELSADGKTFVLGAGVGFRRGLIGTAIAKVDGSNQASHTLRTQEPVVVEDMRTETRFDSPVLRDHGAVCGMTVIIGNPGKPLGVIGVHRKTLRRYSQDDILFLKTVAVMLASAMTRKRSGDALKASEVRMRGAIESLQEGFALFDADDRLVMVNDVYRRINPNAQELLDAGAKFAELIRVNVERGLIADAIGREEEFIRDRIALHRETKEPIIRRHSDGRWYIIKETRTPEGGTAITFTDITELKRVDEALLDSREQFRAVVDASPSAITLKDLDGRFLLVNRTFAEWMNATPREIVGKTVDELFPEQYREIRDQDRKVMETGAMTALEMTARHGDGRTRDVLLTKGPVRSAAGDIVAVCAVVTDVTGLKHASRALNETQERFQAVVDNLPMAINVKDRSGRYVLVNRQFTKWYGMAADRFIGKRPEDVSPLMAPTARRRDAHEEAVIDTKSALSRDDRIKRVDGKFHDIEVTKFPILDANGKVALVGTIAADITERKQAEQNMAELNAELAHVSRISTMGEMAAGLAHELNQPLTAITNYAKGTLRRLHAGGADTVDLLPIMELIAEQALRAGDIIRKIRGFMNRSEPQKTRIDMRRTIDEVMSLLAGEINLSGIEVAVEVSAGLPKVNADSIQIQQVLLNLIRNAVAAMEGDGSVNHRLEIGAIANGIRDVEIYVRDNGPGIPADVGERLFEPFFTTKVDGLGMGLSISRSIVTGHNGRIWVSSEAGHGATFHFTLPAVADQAHDAA